MANERKVGFLRGEAMYPKVLVPVPNYNKDGFEWTIDLKLDDASEAQVRSEMSPKVIKEGEIGKYVRFKQGTTFVDRETGETKARKAPEVIDANGNDWPKDVKIGNGSIVDVKYTYVDNGKGKNPSTYLLKLRVVKHVPYTNDFPELTEEEREWATTAIGETSVSTGSPQEAEVPTVAESKAQDTGGNNPDVLDDDVPF